jgi:AraC-like DNA-binding protein
MFVDKIYWGTERSPLGHITQASYEYGNTGIQRGRVYGAYAIVLVTKGSGYFTDINHKRCPLIAGDLMLLFPDVAHSFGPRGADLDDFFIEFEGPIFDLWRSSGLLTVERPLYRLSPLSSWLQRMVDIVTVTAPDEGLKQLIMVGRLQAFLAEIMATDPVDIEAGPDLWLATACFWLETKFGDPFDYRWLADLVEMPYDRFRKRFSQEMGVSPRHFREMKRMEAAKKLLLDTRLSIKEIAALLGFYDEFAFSNRFKSKTEISPREFRKQRASHNARD